MSILTLHEIERSLVLDSFQSYMDISPSYLDGLEWVPKTLRCVPILLGRDWVPQNAEVYNEGLAKSLDHRWRLYCERTSRFILIIMS